MALHHDVDVEFTRTMVTGFVRKYAPYVRAVAVRLAPVSEQADDLAQEAFLALFRKLQSDGLDTTQDLKPWLGQVARNLSHKAWEKALRERRLKRDALARHVEQISSGETEAYGEGYKLALRACRLTREQDPKALVVLAQAYAEMGRFSDAVHAAERALRIVLASGKEGPATAIREQIDRYRRGEPFRQSSAG